MWFFIGKSEGDHLDWILSELKERGKIKSKEVQSFFSIHRDTAIEDLNKLIKQGKIVKRGGGNNIWYELKIKENKNGY